MARVRDADRYSDPPEKGVVVRTVLGPYSTSAQLDTDSVRSCNMISM